MNQFSGTKGVVQVEKTEACRSEIMRDGTRTGQKAVKQDTSGILKHLQKAARRAQVTGALEKGIRSYSTIAGLTLPFNATLTIIKFDFVKGSVTVSLQNWY